MFAFRLTSGLTPGKSLRRASRESRKRSPAPSNLKILGSAGFACLARWKSSPKRDSLLQVRLGNSATQALPAPQLGAGQPASGDALSALDPTVLIICNRGAHGFTYPFQHLGGAEKAISEGRLATALAHVAGAKDQAIAETADALCQGGDRDPSVLRPAEAGPGGESPWAHVSGHLGGCGLGPGRAWRI